LARRISLLDDGVLTFDISKLPKPFLKGSNPSPGLLQSCRDKRQITYPPGPSGLLRHHRGWHSRKPVKVTTKFRRYISSRLILQHPSLNETLGASSSA
jgi:hypothetical protein